MFKNREIRIRVRKADEDADKDDPRNDQTIFEDKIAFVHSAFKDIVKTVGIGVVAYVAMDTVRQVLVEKSKVY